MKERPKWQGWDNTEIEDLIIWCQEAEKEISKLEEQVEEAWGVLRELRSILGCEELESITAKAQHMVDLNRHLRAEVEKLKNSLEAQRRNEYAFID